MTDQTTLAALRGFPRAVFKSDGASVEDWIRIDGKWHHITTVVTPTSAKVYLDGSDVHLQDEIAVYDRALSAEEVAQHYAALRAALAGEEPERCDHRWVTMDGPTYCSKCGRESGR